MYPKLRLIGLLSLLVAVIVTAAPAGDDVLGLWYTEDDEAKVEITRQRGKYYGKIVWLREPLYPGEDEEAGRPKRDRNNPDEARRQDPILGLTVLKDFVFDGSSTWVKGTIYDPNNGKTYRCNMWLEDQGTLRVRGYIGISLFGRTTEWRRVPKESESSGVAGETQVCSTQVL